MNTKKEALKIKSEGNVSLVCQEPEMKLFVSNPKTVIKLTENFFIYSEKRFNRFHKFLIKKLFNFDVKDLNN